MYNDWAVEVIVLASNSQTRAHLLTKFGVQFIQQQSDFDEEKLTCKDPKQFVYQATMGKMESFLKVCSLEKPVLCADTVVTCENKILRKAKTKADAREILTLQSGNDVSIITCMVYKTINLSFIDISSTVYVFDTFDKNELEGYLKSNEWMGKAGACMVEGFCKKYIKTVHGYESTAMGLCVEKLIPFLKF